MEAELPALTCVRVKCADVVKVKEPPLASSSSKETVEGEFWGKESFFFFRTWSPKSGHDSWKFGFDRAARPKMVKN